MASILDWIRSAAGWIVENKEWVFSGIGVYILGGIVAAVGAMFAWLLWRRKSQEKPAETLAARRALRNRRAMIEKVRSIWITGVLERSLYHETMITLGLTERPDVVRRPLDLVMHRPTVERRSPTSLQTPVE